MAGGRAPRKSKLSRSASAAGGGRPSDEAPGPKRLKASIKFYLMPAPPPRAAAQDAGDAAPCEAQQQQQRVQENAAPQLPLPPPPRLPPLPAATPMTAGGAAPLPPRTGGTALGTGRGSAWPPSGAQVGTSLLQSLQRRFVEQQRLATTPAGAAAAAAQQLQSSAGPMEGVAEEAEEEDLDGFVLHSQPAYERVLSQRPQSAGALLDGSAGPSAPPPSQDDGDDARWGAEAAAFHAGGAAAPPPGAPVVEELDAGGAGLAPGGRTPAADAGGHAPLARAAAAAGPRGLFQIFRPRSKHLVIVRHGESEYNAALSAARASWADPQIFDAPLTAAGRAQAAALRRELAAMKLPPDTVWATSPLTRAVETMLLACPVAHLLQRRLGGGGASEAGDGQQAEAGQEARFAVRPELSERLMTTGDVGSSPAALAARFPALAPEMAALPDPWWHCPPGRPNCAARRLHGATEPREALARRLGAFRRWVEGCPGGVVVAFGHSLFWRAFQEGPSGCRTSSMRNCEYRVLNV